jgi:hypothetical protein
VTTIRISKQQRQRVSISAHTGSWANMRHGSRVDKNRVVGAYSLAGATRHGARGTEGHVVFEA